MSEKKLLILNGSHGEIALINAAKSLGFYVITSGNDPSGLGHTYADENIFADYSDFESICKLAETQKIDAVISCSNDFGIITASYVAEKLHLGGHDSFETTCKLHHKDTFRQMVEKYNLHAPRAVTFYSAEKACNVKMDFPVIVKPIDLTGGKGVTKVSNAAELIPAVDKAFDMTRAGKIVIEPFIEGTAHSFSTFLIGKKVAAYYSDNEYTYKNPFLISSSAGPATGVEKVKNILIGDIEKLAQELNLVDGIFHVQYILRDNQPYILEATRRTSGDLYSIPVEYALKINWSKMTVQAESGLPVEKLPQPQNSQLFAGRHCIMGDKNGVVKNVEISDELTENIFDKCLWWKSGFTIENYLKDKLGILFLKFDTESEMLDKINRITELVKVIYEN